MKTRIFLLLFTGFLISLWFVDNIAVRDRDTYVSREEVFTANHPGLNDFGDPDTVKTESAIDLSDFFNFIGSMKDRPFRLEEVSYLDTTGDGKLEKVSRMVELKKGLCYVRNSIENQGHDVLWDEEFTLNDGHIRMAFGNDSRAMSLPSYALFYLGVLNARFVEEAGPVTLSASVTRQLAMSFAVKKGYEPDEVEELEDGIRAYKGMVVFRLQEGFRAMHLWNEASGSFEPVMEIVSDIQAV